MPRPSNLDGKAVPARTYRRYLEDFYHYFIKGKADIFLNTKVSTLRPTPGTNRGWSAKLVRGEQEEERDFDKVVIATGFIGKPYIPDTLRTYSPIFHTASLSDQFAVDKLLQTVPFTDSLPSAEGDDDTILVVGGGKSGMDTAAWLTNRGRKAVWAFRGEMKWFSPAFPPGSMGANRLNIFFGPSRYIDSWAMWFYHCTVIGAKYIKRFWTMMRSVWSTVYTESIPAPYTDPFLTLPHFAGGIPVEPTDFISLVRSNRIAVLSCAAPTSAWAGGVNLQMEGGEHKVRCGGIVAATGYKGDVMDFLDLQTRKTLGLERERPSEISAENVRQMGRRWCTVTVPNGEEEKEITLPMVLRGILPIGRFEQRDLAVAGGTKPFSIPAITYEVESHWISSLFKEDSFLRLPRNQQECLKEIHEDNDFVRARYPGVDPYANLPAGTNYTGFNDLSYTRTLLRDLSLDPWRQKSNAKWWQIWKRAVGWLDVKADPEQYASIGQERQELRKAVCAK